VRSMTDPLSHFDPAGAARMVTVTDKPETPRGAIARARVRMAAATLARIRGGAVLVEVPLESRATRGRSMREILAA